MSAYFIRQTRWDRHAFELVLRGRVSSEDEIIWTSESLVGLLNRALVDLQLELPLESRT